MNICVRAVFFNHSKISLEYRLTKGEPPLHIKPFDIVLYALELTQALLGV